MIKKLSKILIIIICLTTIFMPQKIYAFNSVIDDLGGDLSVFDVGPSENAVELEKKSAEVWDVVQVSGMVASVIVLIVIGIYYMTCSVEAKAEYKKIFWMYIIGAVLLFTGTLTPRIIFQIVGHL